MQAQLAGGKAVQQHDGACPAPSDGDRISVIPLNSHDTPMPIAIDSMQLMEDETSAMRSKARLYAILAALYGSLFIAALDVTIVATSVVTIVSDLHSASGYTWISGAYLLANAAAAPIWAKLSDIWGRKPIFLTVTALFFASSVICAMSTSMVMLIVGRAIQGTAGGGIFQLVAIVISDLFSMRQRTIFFGFMEAMWAAASGVGPILGGVFAQKLSWRWIWWINLPLSGICFVLIFFFMDVHNPRTKIGDGLKALDWAGLLSIVGLTLMLLLGLEFGGETFPWDSPRVICLIVFGALMSLIFIWSEKKLAKYPLMPLELFSNRSTLGCLLVDFCHAFAFVSAQFYVPLYLQAATGASPLRAGILSIPLVITASAAGLITGVIIHRTGRYTELIWTGTISLAIGTGLYILWNADSSIALIVGLQCIGGTAAGLLFQPPLIATQAQVSQDIVATATATYGFVRELSSAVAIVVGGVIFQNGMSLRQGELRVAGASVEVLKNFAGSDAAANVLTIKDIADERVRQVVREAFAWALRNVWIGYTVVAVAGVLATSLISHKNLTEEHTETKTGLKEK